MLWSRNKRRRSWKKNTICTRTHNIHLWSPSAYVPSRLIDMLRGRGGIINYIILCVVAGKYFFLHVYNNVYTRGRPSSMAYTCLYTYGMVALGFFLRKFFLPSSLPSSSFYLLLLLHKTNTSNNNNIHQLLLSDWKMTRKKLEKKTNTTSKTRELNTR